MSDYMRVCHSRCEYVNMSICQSVCEYVSMSVCRSMCEYVSMFINQSMPTCISVWFKPSEGLLITWRVVCRSTALTFRRKTCGTWPS